MKRMCMALAALVCIISLSGCVYYPAESGATPPPPLAYPVFTDKEAVYAMYNQISFPGDINEIRSRFGEPKVDELEGGRSYTWAKDGYGVACAFEDQGQLRGKTLFFEDARQLSGLMEGPIRFENAQSIQVGISYDECVAALGVNGVEISTIAEDVSLNPTLSKVYFWVDVQGSNVQAQVDSSGKVINTFQTIVTGTAPAETPAAAE